MTRARELAELGAVYDNSALSNRNLIMNGAMQVAQRGTSFDPNGTSNAEIQLVDRWMAVRRSTVGALTYDATITQSTDTPTGFDKSLKVDVDTAQTPTGSDNALIVQKIEGQNLQQFGWGSSDAKPITLSFWVKSNKTGTYCIQTRYTANTDSGLYEYSISSSGVWEHKTLTIPANTSLTFASTNTTGMEIMFNLAVGSSDHAAVSNSLSTTGFRATSNQVNLFDNAANYWQITGVQLEVGDTATEFENRSFGQQLDACSRYYSREEAGSGGAYKRYGVGSWNSATHFECLVPLSTPMRTTPTLETIAASNYAIYSANATRVVTSLALINDSDAGTYNRAVSIIMTVSSGGVAGEGGTLLANNDDDNFLAFDAEL